jgi:[NiFe] hydrogenase diaphorase moiety small subunit
MSKNGKIYFEIDGKPCIAEEGQSIIDAAKDNGHFIPSLCHIEGVEPSGSCRICNVKVNGRTMTACTTPVTKDITVENDIPELTELRKSIIEMLFVSGNHFCPSCEKSGNCELQALAYRYQIMVTRYPHQILIKGVDAHPDHIFLDRNRCILCKKCIRVVIKEGKNVFAFHGRGGEHLHLVMDEDLASQLTEEEARAAMDICPVGAILKKEHGFIVPIGSRKFDKVPIGNNIEN